MNTTDSSKVSDANAGANNVIHIPHNPTLAGLATLTRNVAYKTGADNLVMDIISPQSTGDDDDLRVDQIDDHGQAAPQTVTMTGEGGLGGGVA